MSQPSDKKHIMISYNWGSQTFAKDICAKLIEEEYNVWMDTQTGPDEGMKKDIITGMTNGLSGACCLLVILSKPYEESMNCRTELRTGYARKIPMLFLKHPTHKVEDETFTIMNTSLYYEYDVDPVDRKMKVKNLQAFLAELAHRFPAGSPARAKTKTRILLVGCAGVGKSTIASLLINGSVKNGLNPGDIYVSAGAAPGTWATSEISNDQFEITDTMGIGLEDMQINPFGTANAVKNLKDFLITSRKGYHFIFLVTKISRRMAPQVQAYKMFYQGLFPDMRARFVMIVTDQNLTSSAAPQYVADLSEQIDAHMPGISTKILVNMPVTQIPSLQAGVKEFQRISRERIMEYINENKNLKAKVPECSMIERGRFYYYIREVLKLLGFEWNDAMEKLLISMDLSEQARNSMRMLI